ncbi:MAG: hypothetical protein K5697_16965 [Lachnospiraceae bacterium]|nr:hypothetical protein [Lachnospiraceae bacterium]
MSILALLGMGKYMTLKQIRAFLLLKGFEMEEETIEQHILALKEYGMIVEYEFRGGFGEQDKVVRLYAASYSCGNILRELGAPEPNPQESFVMSTQMGKKNSICGCVLWNQIILNQILYHPVLSSFRVQEAVRLDKWKKICIPLSMNIRERCYIFDLIRTFHDVEMIADRMRLWEGYAARKGNWPIVVLVCESDEHEQWVAGCTRRIEAEHISFATSTEDRWLHAKSGTISYRDVMLS